MINVNSLLNFFGVFIMVTSDTGLPDPDNPNNELVASNEGMILVTDDEEDSDDQETIVLEEYQPLPLYETADSNHASSEDESQENDIDNAVAAPPVPEIIPVEQILVKEVWSVPPPPTDIEMDSKKVDEVKQVMSTITLPPSSIPDWASNISEEEWKQQLTKRLQAMKGEGSA